MKRRRVAPAVAGGAVEASLENIGAAFTNDGVAASLPRIPGLSMEHIPTFLHVLQVTTKFFQKDLKTDPFTVMDWEQLKNKTLHGFGQGADSGGTWNSGDGINTNGHGNIHDSIMNRMQAVSSNSGSTPTASSNDDDHKRRFIQAATSWMEEVQYHARRRKKQESNDGASTTENSGKREEKPVPYSMFLYLWDMQQEHKRVTVRRSALFLSGLLLLRSKDCRYHIDQETHLADWVSNIGVKVDGRASRDGVNSNRKIIQLALLQKEAIALVSHLLDKGFGSRYVKLAVAAKSLKHRCIALETCDLDTTSVTPPGMANRRKLRDFALLHGQKEIQKVGKLLDLSDECLEILVPRIDGIRRPSRSWKRQSISGGNQDLGRGLEEKKQVENQEKSRPDNTNGDVDYSESDDDDDIDWEDGDEVETNNKILAIGEQNLHLSAVESTMAAMEKTAGNTLFSGGRLEINFDQRVDDEDDVRTGNETHVPDENKARRKLEKIVQKLSTRHLVRLSAWLDGLRNSDNLVHVDSASLVSLSPAKDELRRELISRLSALKQDVSTVLSSASRLSIRVQDGMNNDRAQTPEANDSATVDRNRNAVASLEGMPAAPASRAELPTKRIAKKKRRIKISYNK